MNLGKFITNFANTPKGKKIFKKVLDKNKAAKKETSTVKTETPTFKKNNIKKFASIGLSQMRSGRSATILNQSSLLNDKYKIKKKTLLGS